jgi:hypothetical protein
VQKDKKRRALWPAGLDNARTHRALACTAINLRKLSGAWQRGFAAADRAGAVSRRQRARQDFRNNRSPPDGRAFSWHPSDL